MLCVVLIWLLLEGNTAVGMPSTRQLHQDGGIPSQTLEAQPVGGKSCETLSKELAGVDFDACEPDVLSEFQRGQIGSLLLHTCWLPVYWQNS
jgi:hypothetical protein